MTLATVDIVRRTGSSGGPTDTIITASSTRASTSDVAVPGANNPIPIPVSGTNYSFWVITRLKVQANPDGHTINNVKWFSSTTNQPGGVTIMGNKATSYIRATGTVGVSGTQLTTGAPGNYTTLTAPVSVFSFTSAAFCTLGGSVTTTGFGTLDHFVWQVGLDSTVTPASPAPANTYVFRYDEA